MWDSRVSLNSRVCPSVLLTSLDRAQPAELALEAMTLNCVVFAELNRCASQELRRLCFETDGQDLIEYALLTTFIGFAGAAAWGAMQTSLGILYGGVADAPWALWEPADPVGGGS